MGSDTRQK